MAPMDGVTDAVFRQMLVGLGKPDVMFTEFVSCNGLISRGKDAMMEHLRYTDNEQPIVAQIWGSDPENFFRAAEIIKPMGFAGIDINMGCPDRTVIKEKGGAALIGENSIVAEIIDAVKRGSGGLPVSVKTRTGTDKPDIYGWIGFLLSLKPAAISVHLRTAKQLYHGQSDWGLMDQITGLRKTISPETVIIGNGDIKSLSEITEKTKIYACEGYMIGRETLNNPWIFNPEINPESLTVREKLEAFISHIEIFSRTWGNSRNPATLKKFCPAYISNFSGAAALRKKLMEAKTITDFESIISINLRSLK
jgi:nifR3 family TIM-barrel protein